VELGSLLVPKERVRDPDVLLRVEAQSDLVQLGARRLEAESVVAPRLSEVDVHLIILNGAKWYKRLAKLSTY